MGRHEEERETAHVTKLLLDGNVYDMLRDDDKSRLLLSQLVADGLVQVLATPVVVAELKGSSFSGVPAWFPISVVAEAVTVLGHARLGMARLSSGKLYRVHRGESRKVRDAIIAHSANALADALVSQD
jgi:hypothetical protein